MGSNQRKNLLPTSLLPQQNKHLHKTCLQVFPGFQCPVILTHLPFTQKSNTCAAASSHFPRFGSQAGRWEAALCCPVLLVSPVENDLEQEAVAVSGVACLLSCGPSWGSMACPWWGCISCTARSAHRVSAQLARCFFWVGLVKEVVSMPKPGHAATHQDYTRPTKEGRLVSILVIFFYINGHKLHNF